MLCATALQSGQTTLPACAAKQVISSPWGAPLLGLPKPVADSHAKDAPRQIPSNFRTSPHLGAHLGECRTLNDHAMPTTSGAPLFILRHAIMRIELEGSSKIRRTRGRCHASNDHS